MNLKDFAPEIKLPCPVERHVARVRALVVFCLYVFMLAVGISPSWASNADDLRSRRVMLLNSYHKGYKWSDEIVIGVEDILGKLKKPPRLHVEYLDSIAHSGQEYIHKLEDLYQAKYGNPSRLDLLIVSDNAAFDYAIKRRETLFRGVPIVFVGVNDFNSDQIKGVRDITGYPENIDFITTIKAGLRLFPNTSRILVTVSQDMTSTKNRAMLRAQLERSSITMPVEYIEAMQIDEVENRLRATSRPNDLGSVPNNFTLV